MAALALVALLHPALMLRRGQPLSRGRKLAVLLSTGMVVVTFLLGSSLYPAYRRELKEPLVSEAAEIAALFETKEHIAWLVLTLSLSACCCALVAPRDATGLRKLAALTFFIATVATLIAFVLGTVVASVRSF